MSYTKLFSTLITSTVWSENDRTRIVWITMLALADQHGEVHASVPGLARMANVPVEDCRAAIARFLSPDPDSRTKDDDGRRIEEIRGGWQLLNYQQYRHMRSKEEIIEQTRERVRRHRSRMKRNVTPGNAPSRSGYENPTEAEAEAEADSESVSSINTESISESSPTGERERVRENAPATAPQRSKSGTRIPQDWRPNDDGRTYAAERGLDPEATAAAFADWWTAANGPNAIKRDWNAAFRTWIRRDAARPMVQAANGSVRATTGRGAYLEQLAAIARRASAKPPDGG